MESAASPNEVAERRTVITNLNESQVLCPILLTPKISG